MTSFLQVLGAVSGFLEKGKTHFEANGVDLQSIVESRVATDMLPFAFQIASVAHHSRGALDGAKSGVFNPPGAVGDPTYAGLQKLVADAQAALKALTPDEVNALEGRDMVFELRDRCHAVHSGELPALVLDAEPPFPRLDRLRHPAPNGVTLGKRDFMGAMRMKS